MEVPLSDFQNDIMREIAEKEGFTDFELKTTSGSSKGDNYLGVITNVSVKNHKRKLELIMKSSTASEKLREQIPIGKLYCREIYLYETIFPAFETFEKEGGILKDFSCHAKIYGSCTKEFNEFLVLENLKEVGYRLWNRKITMTADHVALVLSEYGKFHATSLAMKEKKPEFFKTLTENLDDVFATSVSKREQHLVMIKTVVENALKSVKGSQIAIDALGRFSSIIEQFIFEDINVKEDELVLLHGDCWCNNILFKYENSKPSKVCLIDWQLSSVGSPAKDLAYFLFTCASKEILSDYRKYLKIYHDSVCDALRQFHVDAETVYPFSLVEQHWKKYAKFGIHMALMIVKLMLSEVDEAPDMAAIAESGKDFVTELSYESVNSDEYDRRILDMVTVAAENDWL